MEKGKIEFDDPNFKPINSLIEQLAQTAGYQVGASATHLEIKTILKELQDLLLAEINTVHSQLEDQEFEDYRSAYAERIEGELMGLNTALELVEKANKKIANLFK